MLSADCKHDRKCAQQCHCANRQSAIHQIVALYLDPLNLFEDQTSKEFVSGYAGILVGLVMLDSEPIQDLVLKALHGRDAEKLELAKAMQGLAEMHDKREVQERNGGMEQMEEDGSERKKGLAASIRAIADKLA